MIRLILQPSALLSCSLQVLLRCAFLQAPPSCVSVLLLSLTAFEACSVQLLEGPALPINSQHTQKHINLSPTYTALSQMDSSTHQMVFTSKHEAKIRIQTLSVLYLLGQMSSLEALSGGRTQNVVLWKVYQGIGISFHVEHLSYQNFDLSDTSIDQSFLGIHNMALKLVALELTWTACCRLRSSLADCTA